MSFDNKNYNNMIKYCLQVEIKSQYFQEIQWLNKTFTFEIAGTKNLVGYYNVLENVVVQTKVTALLLSNFVLNIKFIASIIDPTSSFSNMKLVAILIIFYKFTY